MPDLVIIGAGFAAHRLCRALVARRMTDAWRVTVLGEDGLPIARESLPDLLTGRPVEAIQLAPAAWYADHGIRLLGDQPAVLIDRARQRVVTAAGEELPYDRLVLATGAAPYLPPIEGRDLPGVMTVRSVTEAQALAVAAQQARRVVVLGGGPLGLAIADRLRQQRSVELIELAAGLCLRQLDLVCAEQLRRRAEAVGIAVHTGRQVLAIVAGANGLGVHSADGSRVGADLVVLACGARPRDELAAAAGVRRGLRGGVVVDEQQVSSDPSILALGACAVRDGRVQDDDDAIAAQASICADHLAGKPSVGWEPLPALTRMDVGGLTGWSLGDVHGAELDRRIHWQDTLGRRVIVTRGHHLVGACGIGPWPELPAIAGAIANRSRVWLWQLARFRRQGRLWPEEARPVVGGRFRPATRLKSA